MNVFIRQLSIKHLSVSPYFSNKGLLNIAGCSFRTFFGSCIYNTDSIRIKNSLFNKFLQTSIITTSLTYTGLYTSRLGNLGGSDTIITNCMFMACTGTTGGALYQNSYRLAISHSSFYQCSASGGCGGAVHFEGGSIATMYCTCGVDCYANGSPGQFIRFVVPQASTSSNYILLNMSSVNLCAKTLIPSTFESTIIAFGYVGIDNFNSSNNIVAGDSSGLAPHSVNYKYEIKFCTLKNNYGNNALRLIEIEQHVYYFNIVNNTHRSGEGIIKQMGKNYIFNTFIVNNNGKAFSGGSLLELHNCYVNGELGFSNPVLTQCITNYVGLTTNILTHLGTFLCHTDLVKHTLPQTRKIKKEILLLMMVIE